MLWGDAPADKIGDGLSKLINRLRADLGRFPTAEEVDAEKASSPEMDEAIADAILVFCDDIGRQPTDGEIVAGLAFSDTGIALDSAIRADIVPGDTIRWAIWNDTGVFSEVERVADAVVEAIEERKAVSGWTGRPYTKVVYVVTLDGVRLDVGREWASKVLPGDDTVEQINAARAAREKAESWLDED